jgi:hypothetical protein
MNPNESYNNNNNNIYLLQMGCRPVAIIKKKELIINAEKKQDIS